ncbi:hypothetical protein [Actinomyces glycerinitolerans]|uniref:hypothetical protein n=1 Tax=Actinomyces glycerinitolerans TaxID=1892869 RepID=UPI001114BED0|nr:hypothetical protein [Actinomyces glycerinitolerans]
MNAVVEPPAQTGCSTTAVLDTPTDPTGWAEEWRLDSGRGDLLDVPNWQAFSAGDCLVIVSERHLDTPAKVTGYHLTSTGAEELWTRSGDDPDGKDINRLYPGEYAQWWGGYLATGRLLLDPSTGDLTQAPWADESGVVISIAEELAINCRHAYSSSAATCSAWDWNDGNPSQRWKQDYEEDMVYPTIGFGMSGNVQDGSLVANTESDAENTRTYTLMSLADGSLHGNWPRSTDAGGFPVFIPARDGWLLLSKSQNQAALITSGGEEGQPFPVIAELPTVLLTDGELPMLAQLRAAYRDGDFDWADVVLQCRDTSACTLNGNEVDLPESVLIDTYLQGGYYQRMAALTADGRSLVLRSRPNVNAWAIVFDTESGEVLVPEYSQDRSKGRALVRTTDDLILMGVDSEVIAYTPS